MYSDPYADPHEPVTDLDAAFGYIGRICFKIGPPRLFGLELEWLVGERGDPAAILDLPRLAGALGPWAPAGLLSPDTVNSTAALLPNGSAVSVEPGGQLELSTAPAPSLPALLAAATADAHALRTRLGEAGLVPLDLAAEPLRDPRRLRDTPRYRSMEAYFDRRGPAGRTMMCSTAAVQPSVDTGTETGPDSLASRWHLLHALGPVLVAIFANSPWLGGRRTGWKSSRQAAWLEIDPERTGAPVGDDPRETYARYALDAPLLCIRADGPGGWQVPQGVRMADWIRGALPNRPSYDDLKYHLSTLFPPVRAQGHLEVRYLDAQAGENWSVIAAVVWALLSTAEARDAARGAAEPVAGRWADAARCGPESPGLGRAAGEVMAIALEALQGRPGFEPIHAAVLAFAERYTLRGRCPADDWAGLNPPSRRPTSQEATR